MPFVHFLKEGNKMKVSNPIDMQNNDISFQTDDDRRFRLRAAAIIIENGEVLFATNTAEKYYYSIGGAIELGETAEHAVCRGNGKMKDAFAERHGNRARVNKGL